VSLGFTQPLREISTRDKTCFCGAERGRCMRLTSPSYISLLYRQCGTLNNPIGLNGLLRWQLYSFFLQNLWYDIHYNVLIGPAARRQGNIPACLFPPYNIHTLWPTFQNIFRLTLFCQQSNSGSARFPARPIVQRPRNSLSNVRSFQWRQRNLGGDGARQEKEKRKYKRERHTQCKEK
jgi:hypothetical protein